MLAQQRRAGTVTVAHHTYLTTRLYGCSSLPRSLLSGEALHSTHLYHQQPRGCYRPARAPQRTESCFLSYENFQIRRYNNTFKYLYSHQGSQPSTVRQLEYLKAYCSWQFLSMTLLQKSSPLVQQRHISRLRHEFSRAPDAAAKSLNRNLNAEVHT